MARRGATAHSSVVRRHVLGRIASLVVAGWFGVSANQPAVYAHCAMATAAHGHHADMAMPMGDDR